MAQSRAAKNLLLEAYTHPDITKGYNLRHPKRKTILIGTTNSKKATTTPTTNRSRMSPPAFRQYGDKGYTPSNGIGVSY